MMKYISATCFRPTVLTMTPRSLPAFTLMTPERLSSSSLACIVCANICIIKAKMDYLVYFMQV